MIGIKKIPPTNSQNPFRCDFYNLPGRPLNSSPSHQNEVECTEEMMRVGYGRLCSFARRLLKVLMTDCRVADTALACREAPMPVAAFADLHMLHQGMFGFYPCAQGP